MTARLKIIVLLLMLSASSIVFAQTASEKSRVKLRGKGRSLVLTSGRVRRALNVREQVNAARLDEVKLLFETRRESFTYLLVDACGPSRLVPDARRCGAAEECSLLWIKLDAAWKISDIKAARYESCWQSSTSSDGFKISGRKLQMEYDDFSGKKSYRLSYDADQAERGLQVEESALRQSD